MVDENQLFSIKACLGIQAAQEALAQCCENSLWNRFLSI